jgi:hypothetical protein
MNLIATKHWEGDGSAVNIDLGFIPDFAIMLANTGQTNPDIYLWFRRFVDDQSMYGLLITGSTGVVTRVTTAATGLDAFDSKFQQVRVESPVPGRGKQLADVSDWAASTSATARTASAVGTIVRPTTKNGYVYECTTGGTTNDTEGEPTWPTTPGDTVTETDGVVWTCREEEAAIGGAKGLTAGATTQTDAREYFIYATKSELDRDAGDAAEVGANAAI